MGSAFRCLSPEHTRPCPKPLLKHPAPPCNLEAEQTFLVPTSQYSMSYILSQRGLLPAPLPTSPLPSLLSPGSPPRPCQQAGRKLLIVGRVGHFQLTLNNPGLGYKESGPSAPVTRHPPQPPQLYTHCGGQGLPSPQVRASYLKHCTALCSGERAEARFATLIGSRRSQGPGYSPTEGSVTLTNQGPWGWGLSWPPQWQKT